MKALSVADIKYNSDKNETLNGCTKFSTPEPLVDTTPSTEIAVTKYDAYGYAITPETEEERILRL